ncbi:hypothetical protein EMIHUDRAFT_439512 [Emiliania huxleyi CCMP1516]|uniref:Uncharacterized protein n=2 Tax=Emiliania huxleyi TaxID=2903 RepID=A0A0D3KYQ8_EMIH1|nr:hypothetical protein EMIHUDRAFT_439512 [Emiliania huxleyi CCMP1516]EOD40893.1 hypothetical protein EMIHUDRAFT_439512 [Emiliania huxleyi CCMP1516]|eukprot:XP_005793322.1 hypothetical protein EMIHUDRAFT_439512 [Emiliania huxleyi CCMP1516]
MSDDYAQKPTQEYGTTRDSSTGNSIQNLLVTLSVAGLWLLVTAAAPQGGYGAPDYEYPSTYWDKYRKYAVSVGAVGLGLGLIALLMTRFKPDMSDKKMLSIKSTDVSVLGAFSIFFVLWWGVGAGVCTFKSPFAPDGTSAVPAGNGYFSVWTGFLASLLLLSKTMSIGDAKSLKGRAAGLFFAAVMLLIATIKYVDPNDGVEFPSAGPQTQTTDDIAIFGMASAAATILITIMIIFADMKESAIQTLIPILVLLWAATAGVLTFRSGSPFTGMNNGYFSSWFGFFMAAQMTGSASGPLNSNIFQILALGVVVVLSAYFYQGAVTTPVAAGVVDMVYQDNIVPDRQAYMIAVGAVAGFLALFHYWCSVFKPALLETVLFNVSDSPVSMRRAMAIFLVPWVAAGAIVGTFGVTGGGIFVAPATTANGYFSIWLLLVACLAHLGSEAEAAVENVRAVANADALSSSMFAFLFASVIVLGSLLQDQDNVIQEGRSDDVRGMFGEYVYSLVLVCISAFVGLYHLVLKEPLPLVNKIATPLLALGWLGAAGVLTFRDSAGFSVAGNGFFAVYVGLFLSFALVGKVHLSPARDDPPAADAVISAA